MSGRRARAFRAYQKIKTLKPRRSLFDLSHEVLMTADMFKLYPCCIMEMSPGDTFHIWNQSVVRMQPLNAPVMSEIWQNTHYFFVPFRILWPEWVKFITGNEDGLSGGFKRSDSHINEDDVLDEPSDVTPELPRWIPTDTDVGSLWDYCGFPTGVNPKGAYPEAFVKYAYNLIWNEYYRDENLQEPVDKDNEQILYRSWKKDYFTSALLSQQRGLSPVMPVNGTVNLLGSSNTVSTSTLNQFNSTGFSVKYVLPAGLNQNLIKINSNQTIVNGLYIPASGPSSATSFSASAFVVNSIYDSQSGDFIVNFNFSDAIQGNITQITSRTPVPVVYTEINEGDGALGAGFDIKDLRQAFQIQKWLELANRGGVRYTEFLRAFFGVSPRDDRLQRPEYIGGSKSPVIVSEVLQTNASTQGGTPLAYMAGRGVGASKTYIGSYSATEYGLVFGLMSFTTPPVYTQGIDRQFLRRSKYDFLFPQFTGLSEQAIEGAEVFATEDETENRKVWGFNEVYDELRSMTNKVVGKMRTVFRYWHLARFFTEKPALNADFIEGKDVSKRIFAVQSEDGFIVNYANIIKAVRPLPKYGTPSGV